jgi:hypothetical protein
MAGVLGGKNSKDTWISLSARGVQGAIRRTFVGFAMAPSPLN